MLYIYTIHICYTNFYTAMLHRIYHTSYILSSALLQRIYSTQHRYTTYAMQCASSAYQVPRIISVYILYH